MRLGKFCGNGPGLWLRLQQEVDLWDAGTSHGRRAGEDLARQGELIRRSSSLRHASQTKRVTRTTVFLDASKSLDASGVSRNANRNGLVLRSSASILSLDP